MNVDTLKHRKEFNDIQCDWILGEVRAIRSYLDSIEFEANKQKQSNFSSGAYIFEKTEKAKSSIENIERRYNLIGKYPWLESNQ